MNDDTKAVQGDALSARTTAPKFARSSLGRHAHRFDDSPISFQVTLPNGLVQRYGSAAPRFAVFDEGRIGEAYLAGDLDIDGIGFTMSLFIAGLAYDPAILNAAKIGILAGSAVSAIAGLLMLFWLTHVKRIALV